MAGETGNGKIFNAEFAMFKRDVRNGMLLMFSSVGEVLEFCVCLIC